MRDANPQWSGLLRCAKQNRVTLAVIVLSTKMSYRVVRASGSNPVVKNGGIPPLPYNNPTVGFAIFWPVESLTSEELPVFMINVTRRFIFQDWRYRRVERIAQANAFEVMFRLRYRAPYVRTSETSSSLLRPLYRRMTTLYPWSKHTQKKRSKRYYGQFRVEDETFHSQ